MDEFEALLLANLEDEELAGTLQTAYRVESTQRKVDAMLGVGPDEYAEVGTEEFRMAVWLAICKRADEERSAFASGRYAPTIHAVTTTLSESGQREQHTRREPATRHAYSPTTLASPILREHVPVLTDLWCNECKKRGDHRTAQCANVQCRLCSGFGHISTSCPKRGQNLKTTSGGQGNPKQGLRGSQPGAERPAAAAMTAPEIQSQFAGLAEQLKAELRSAVEDAKQELSRAVAVYAPRPSVEDRQSQSDSCCDTTSRDGRSQPGTTVLTVSIQSSEEITTVILPGASYRIWFKTVPWLNSVPGGKSSWYPPWWQWQVPWYPPFGTSQIGLVTSVLWSLVLLCWG